MSGQITVGSLLRLVAAAVLFSWRMDSWAATRDLYNGMGALAWGIVTFALAYRIWALGRVGR